MPDNEAPRGPEPRRPQPRLPPTRARAVPPRHGDPRAIITPESFTIAPELLGRPLAGPWRRAAAMLLDLCLIALLANAPGFLLAMAGAFVLWRATAAAAGGSAYKRWARLWLRATAAFLFFVALLAAEWPWEREREPADDVVDASDGVVAVSGFGQLFSVGNDILALRRANTPAEASDAADRMIASLESSGVGRADMEAMIAELRLDAAADGTPLPPVALDALAAALGRRFEGDTAAAGPALGGDSALALTRAYAAALETGDTSALGALRPRLATVVAADTIDRLGARIDATDLRAATLDERGDSLESELAALREDGPGLRALLSAFADDLGVGLGWSGLYFTAFLALWRGATPGKRLLRLRVLRLDGRPIRWFAAFERFGGYSAGIATGLLGFAQIFWDRNRQGIHDKIASTVVVIEPS